MASGQNDAYRLVRGVFTIEGKDPDGDTISFAPNDRRLLQIEGFGSVYDADGSGPVRLEGVEAPERHYRSSLRYSRVLLTFTSTFGNPPQAPANPSRQQPMGDRARDALVELMGLVGGTLRVRGAVLAQRGTGGRIAGHLLLEEHVPADVEDGEAIPIPDDLLAETINFKMLRAGMVYPFLVVQTPPGHRSLLRAAARAARDDGLGVWEPGLDKTAGFTLVDEDSIGPGGVLIFPYLFRKCIDYLEVRRTRPDLRLPDWLIETESAPFPTIRKDDELEEPNGPRRLSSLLDQTGQEIALRADLLELTFILRRQHDLPLADPAGWDDRAAGEQAWMFPRMDPDVRETLRSIAECSGEGCLVREKHPYYHADVRVPPDDPAALKTPCRPVVPVRTAKGKVFIIGAYPTARFTGRTRDGGPISTAPGADNVFFLPVGDIWAPLEAVPYFDGYKPRDVATVPLFDQGLLGRLGIDRSEDAWMTNLVKCFLFRNGHVDAYRSLNWLADVPVEATYDRMLEIAVGCSQRHLERELDVCRPKLVIGLGWHPCAIIHGIAGESLDRQEAVFTRLVGVPLRAGQVSDEEERVGAPRRPPWSDVNLIHLLHPETLMRATQQAVTDLIDLNERTLDVAREFIEDLGVLD